MPPRSLVVHAVAFAWFAFVWTWHLTPAAAALPGNHGFGWFFRFLTFYSFSLQTLQLGMAALILANSFFSFMPSVPGKPSASWFPGCCLGFWILRNWLRQTSWACSA